MRKLSLHFGLAVAVAAVLVAGWLLAARPATAQSNPLVMTKGGFQAEEVRVGKSCVVVVWSGNVNQFAAVPCGD
jgi:hypothetical protein